MNPNHAATPLSVASGSEAYSNTMAAPHELFDDRGVLSSSNKDRTEHAGCAP